MTVDELIEELEGMKGRGQLTGHERVLVREGSRNRETDDVVVGVFGDVVL